MEEFNSEICLPAQLKKKKIEDFDDVLTYIGGWGPFQYLLTLIFFPFNAFIGYVYLSPILTMFTPPHWCHVPALANLSREQRLEMAIPRDPSSPGGYSQCSQYLVDWDQLDLLGVEMSGVEEGWNLTSCQHGWEYDIENYHRSIVTDFDWVCDKSWIPALSQSIFFLGAMPGMLVFGWAADQYGRIPTIVISNLIGFITGLAIPFVTGYISFFILRFCMGLCFNTFFIVPYLLVLEFLDESKRTFVGNLGMALILTLSCVVQPWLIKYLVDWRIFNWVLFSQMGLVVFAPFFLPESVRWLMSKGESEKSIKIMKKVAKLNRKQVPHHVYTDVIDLCEAQKKSGSSMGYMDLFQTPAMRRISLLSIILFSLISLLFDATVRNIENLNFNIYMSFTISTGLELPADLLSIVGLNLLGRRWSASLSLLGCCLAIFPCAWLQDQVIAQSVLAMVGRFFATYAMNTGIQFTCEVMPTEIRGQGTALVNVMSMLTTMTSPYIVYSSVISEAAPFILIGLVGLAASLTGLFLPETAGVDLPEKIKAMDTFGSDDRFFWMPLLGQSKRRKNRTDQPVITQAGARDNAAYSSI